MRAHIALPYFIFSTWAKSISGRTVTPNDNHILMEGASSRVSISLCRTHSGAQQQTWQILGSRGTSSCVYWEITVSITGSLTSNELIWPWVASLHRSVTRSECHSQITARLPLSCGREDDEGQVSESNRRASKEETGDIILLALILTLQSPYPSHFVQCSRHCNLFPMNACLGGSCRKFQ